MNENPIKEIIFSISFAENVDIKNLDRFVKKSEIKKAFPISKKGYNANLKADIKNEKETPITDIQRNGYILKSDEPHNKILQVRKGMFAFHKTREYKSYEELIPELNLYWQLLQSCAKRLTVTNVSLRYLNFIEIENQSKFKEYVTIETKSPFKDIDSSFTSFNFNVDTNSNTDVKIIVAKGVDGTKNGIILDIILNRHFKNKTFCNISDAFNDMRKYKNDIFEKCITKKTKNKYQL